MCALCVLAAGTISSIATACRSPLLGKALLTGQADLEATYTSAPWRARALAVSLPTPLLAPAGHGANFPVQ